MNRMPEIRTSSRRPGGEPDPMPRASLDALVRFVRTHRRLFVLTGAGVSTGSGIPDYRDADGRWKRSQPMRYAEFTGNDAARRRYWARAMVGWDRFSSAAPGPAHVSLAELESRGFVRQLVTQNVDGLHQRAGSRRVLDLHGRLDEVECLGCRRRSPRESFQWELRRHNPGFRSLRASAAPDGDADLRDADLTGFDVPACPDCGGVWKPSVVFFGESVPRERVQRAFARLDEADGMLVVGSSLMVWSGYRFARHAAAACKPVAAVNLGRTRADGELDLKLEHDCDRVLPRLVEALS
jgi:NAD-dependent SIR2 family protein deacetylase